VRSRRWSWLVICVPVISVQAISTATQIKHAVDALLDYFHNPADTLWVLASAVPYLTPEVAQSTKAYLQNEYAAYKPTTSTHVGWRDGASRDWFDLPPDVDPDRVNYPPTEWGAMNSLGGGKNMEAPTSHRTPSTPCGNMPRPLG